MKKADDPGCSSTPAFLLSLGLMGYVLCQVVQFFQRPDAFNSILEFLGALGACVGVAVGLLLIVGLLARLTDRGPSSKVVELSKHYRVRCYAPVTPPPPEAIQAASADDLASALVEPVYALCALTNYGPRLEAASIQGATADNASCFKRLSDNQLDAFILPATGIRLAYVLYPQSGNRALDLAPAVESEATGPLPALSAGVRVEVVIACTAICTIPNLSYLTLAQPLKLALVALDEAWQEDQAATYELYTLIFDYLQPKDSGSDDDDSWLYRSRPMWY